MTYQLGIDMGTTSVAAAVGRDGTTEVVTLGSRSGAVPAVVFARADGVLIFGEAAESAGASEPGRLVRGLKRRFGDPGPVVLGDVVSTPEDLTAALLSWVVGRVSEREGEPPARTVVTYPAGWSQARLDRLSDAVRRSGIPQVVLVTEPQAAAFHVLGVPGPGVADSSTTGGPWVGTFDLGGSFEAAVLRVVPGGYELAGRPERVEHLGGDEFDEALLFHVTQRVGVDLPEGVDVAPHVEAAFRGLRQQCVAAKEALSSTDEVEVPVLLPGIDSSVPVSRAEFDLMVRPALLEALGAFRRSVRSAGVTPADLGTVLLLGGSSRLQLVPSLVAAEVPQATLKKSDPTYAVCRGAARWPMAGPVAAPAPSPGPEGLAGAALVGAGVAGAAVASAAPAAAKAAGPAAAASAAPGGPPSGSPPPGASGPRQPTPPAPAGAGRRRGVALAIGVLAVLVLAPLLFWLVTREDDNSLATPADSTTVGGAVAVGLDDSREGPSPTLPVVLASGVDMVAIPAGLYPIGTAGRTADLAEFFIDRREVTGSDYAAFLQQVEGVQRPVGWDSRAAPAGLEDHPVTGVSWQWADAYCSALSKRLPIEAEWEAAARGLDGRLYPWGADPAAVPLPLTGTHAVGSIPGAATATGVDDLVGNVWEWVEQPFEPVTGQNVVRRGGRDGLVQNGALDREAVDPANRSVLSETGFRCTADVVDPALPAHQFRSDIEIDANQVSATTSTAPTPAGGLFDDDFTDDGSGWPKAPNADQSAKGTVVGYHGPTSYHVDLTAPGQTQLVLRGVDYVNTRLTLDAYTLRSKGPGSYRYGIVFRAHPFDRSQMGLSGAREENFYAFTIDPSRGVWELLHRDTLPFRTLESGPLPAGMRITDPNAPDELVVETQGNNVLLLVNGQVVGAAPYAMSANHSDGDVGFFVQTLESPGVHVHLDRFRADAL